MYASSWGGENFTENFMANLLSRVAKRSLIENSKIMKFPFHFERCLLDANLAREVYRKRLSHML